MRCISDILIQKFVDKETSEKENAIIHSHLQTCDKCAKKVEERRYIGNRIKELIGTLNKDEVQIPTFREPENQRKPLRAHFKKVVYIAAAACLLVLFLILRQKPEDKIDLFYSYDIESEYNANLPLLEQEMVIKIVDSKGKLIKQ